jgi:hypothetical protein
MPSNAGEIRGGASRRSPAFRGREGEFRFSRIAGQFNAGYGAADSHRGSKNGPVIWNRPFGSFCT